MFNCLWQRLSERLELSWPAMPAAMFLPLMPFQDDSHIFLDDDRARVEQKLCAALKLLSSGNRQLATAANLLTLTPG